MQKELYFTFDERKHVIDMLKDEYGNREFSDELVTLMCQDLWRKGCHHLDLSYCRGCSDCQINNWEKLHPEYKDDELAKRLKELEDVLRAIKRREREENLLAKGYVKVQWKQWNDGKLTTSNVKLLKPGSNDLMVEIAKAIENWKCMFGPFFDLSSINLLAKEGTILELRADQGDEYEIWEIVS